MTTLSEKSRRSGKDVQEKLFLALNLHSPYAMMTFYLRTKEMLSSGTTKRGKKSEAKKVNKRTTPERLSDNIK